MKNILFFLIACLFSQTSSAGSGIFGLDHPVNKTDTGIWSRSNQLTLQYGSAALIVGGAIWEGSESKLGKTYWQSFDAMIIAGIAAQGSKEIFRRQRPSTSNNPDGWFKSSKDKSFYSGEVSHISSIVTPFIVNYQDENPYVWGLAALPIYDAIARVKSKGHWQSDVIVGGLAGTGIGYWATTNSTPISVNIIPGGLSVGYKKKF